jgi:gamma-carbonic anhydrase
MTHSPILIPYRGVMPTIHPSAFIAPGASIIGDVHIGAETNVWFGCVIRGDVMPIRIGARTNIQDGTIVHVTRNTGPTTIGSGVTIGHQAIIHAATIEDDAFVGMGARVLDGAVVESGAFLAAGALLTPNKRVKKGEVWAGNPAKFFRPMTDDEIKYIPWSATHYVALAKEYK